MYLNPLQSRKLYRHAVENRYAILAVNADSHAAITDCLKVARECQSPIIIETSLWQLQGHGFGEGDSLLGIDRYLADLRCLANSTTYKDTPVIYHTDHIKGPSTASILRHAIQQGASSISLDSSELTAEQNISQLVDLCRFSEQHDLPLALEMEAGVDDGVTSLEEAKSLFGAVEEAAPGYLSLWAPGVGTQHGLNNDPNAFSPDSVAQHRQLASEIAGRPIGIALHGSSGLQPTQLGDAVSAGVAKVNWSSESLQIRSQAAAEYFRVNADRLSRKHPDFKATAMDNGLQTHVSQSYCPVVKGRLEALGSCGKAVEFLEILDQ